MALQYSPKIVTDSLVLCIDASQNKSIPLVDLPVKDRLLLWLDAADDSTFSYSSGTEVSQWRDKSGNNFHANQATVGNQPMELIYFVMRLCTKLNYPSRFLENIVKPYIIIRILFLLLGN